MRIAVVASWSFLSTTGGIENHVRFLSRELAERGHDVRIFTPATRGTASGEAEDGLTFEFVDIPPIVHPSPRLQRLPATLNYGFAFAGKCFPNVGARSLAQAVDRWKPDLVWQHDFVSSLVAILILSRKYPIVLTNHTGEYLELWRLARGPLMQLMSTYSHIIGPSRQLTPPVSHATTVPNGVDIELFAPVPVTQRRRWRRRLYGADEGSFVVLVPRRWAPTKGVIYAAQAARALSESGSPRRISFAFVGEDRRYLNYWREVSNVLNGARSGVIRRGPVPVYDLPIYYATADVTLIPSLLEATSLAALESLACGTPVVGTRVGGMPEIVEDGVNGILVNPAASTAIVDAIRTLAGDAKVMSDLRAAARQSVVGRFSWATVADRVEGILRNASTRRRR